MYDAYGNLRYVLPPLATEKHNVYSIQLLNSHLRSLFIFLIAEKARVFILYNLTITISGQFKRAVKKN
jgi:hypothetical protein